MCLEGGVADPPAAPGSYALQMVLATPVRLQIGALGEFDFPEGEYIYTGNAFGPGGLRARISRHLESGRKSHWHIDYLLPSVHISRVYFVCASPPVECVWSQALAELPKADIPVPRFGASDCRSGCKAHLVLLPHVDDQGIHKLLEKISFPATVEIWHI
jgi:Uri superfamily endonuclease